MTRNNDKSLGDIYLNGKSPRKKSLWSGSLGRKEYTYNYLLLKVFGEPQLKPSSFEQKWNDFNSIYKIYMEEKNRTSWVAWVLLAERDTSDIRSHLM